MKNLLMAKCPKFGGRFQSNFGEKRKEAKSMTPKLLTLLLKNGTTENVRHQRSLNTLEFRL